MNRDYIALDLDKILERLSSFVCSEDGKSEIEKLEPQTELSSAQALLNQTTDAHMLMARFGAPSFGGYELQLYHQPLQEAWFHLIKLNQE